MSILDKYPYKIEDIIADIWGDNKKRLNIKEVKTIIELYVRVNDIVEEN